MLYMNSDTMRSGELEPASRIIAGRIAAMEPGTTFVPSDFHDIADPANARQVLRRMERRGDVVRAVRGVYARPRRSEALGVEAPPGTALVTQIDAGGLGLNVQAASVVVICEPQYKPSTVNQAIARAHRMGQARSVIVHRLLCERTIEERMMHRLREKQEIFDAFADKSEAADEVGELDGGNMAEFVREERERVERERGVTENAEEGNRSDRSASEEDRRSPNGAEVRKPRHLAPLPGVEIDDVKSGDDVGGEGRPELPG